MKTSLGRILCAGALIAAGTSFVSAANAQNTTYTLTATGRGLVRSSGTNNGDTATGNIEVGDLTPTLEIRNHFDFAIPEFQGPIVSATLEILEPAFGHGGSATTFSTYSLTTGDLTFADIGAGTLYGSEGIPASVSASIVSVALNQAAFDAILATEGGTMTIGGVDTGTGLFNDFGAGSTSVLSLVIGPTPEPGSVALLVAGLGSGIVIRRRKVRAANR